MENRPPARQTPGLLALIAILVVAIGMIRAPQRADAAGAKTVAERGKSFLILGGCSAGVPQQSVKTASHE